MDPLRSSAFVLLILGVSAVAQAQPSITRDGVRFVYHGQSATSVSLVGDFNGWSKDENPLRRDSTGAWAVVLKIPPGVFQYKFFVDGAQYDIDSANTAMVENFDHSSMNSVFVLTDDSRVVLTSEPPLPKPNPTDEYPPAVGKKPVYLNIIWHQHQPLYVNPEKDQLSGPWVRTHGTKDYYDMAATLQNYPDVHCTINLTSTLLMQLREYYLARLGPFVDKRRSTIDAKGFLARWRGKTDPWIDLALKPTSAFTHQDQDYLYRNAWNAFGISQVMIDRFPEYRALKEMIPPGKSPPYDLFTEQQMREIKFWFYLAYFDPDFLRGPVRLTDGTTCDLSGYVEFRRDGKFYLRKAVTEADCRRMVVEAYRVMSNIIPVHSELRYRADTGHGQVELITTPYCHPILPLLYDSDLARVCQPDDSMPPRFSYPQDARAQVAKAVTMYGKIFGSPPQGMWPGEGAVAQPVLEVLRENGLLWTASDVKVLTRSDPPNEPNTTPYQFPAGDSESISMVFRDTELSDRIGFKYQAYGGEEAAEDFVRTILSRAPSSGDPDVLVTVILDGENAWEWYKKDMDGKEFLNALYRKLTKLYGEKRIITTTTAEYIGGNPSRGIPSHPVGTQPEMKKLWPGSWINANYDTWIGEQEENTAWSYLLRARKDLGRSGLRQPDPHADPPRQGTKAWYAYRAWEEMYAAEGSDWFWWYGNDQTAPGGDKPFDIAYVTHLRNIYSFARLAGSTIVSPGFKEIITDESVPAASQGVMARSTAGLQSVVFICDATGQEVSDAIYIVGSLQQLGDWTPNLVRMSRDSTAGGDKSGRGIWTFRLDVPVGVEIQYKYTNSGWRGEWVPGDEFPGRNRSFTVKERSATPLQIRDTFGK